MFPSYQVIFVVTIISVLAIGVQIRAMSRHQIGLAVGCAAIIAGGQLVAMRIVPGSTSWLDYASYAAANCIGISASFALHRMMIRKTSTFEVPLPICEGKHECPFKAGVCQQDLKQCPAMKVFVEAGKSIEKVTPTYSEHEKSDIVVNDKVRDPD